MFEDSGNAIKLTNEYKSCADNSALLTYIDGHWPLWSAEDKQFAPTFFQKNCLISKRLLQKWRNVSSPLDRHKQETGCRFVNVLHSIAVDVKMLVRSNKATGQHAKRRLVGRRAHVNRRGWNHFVRKRLWMVSVWPCRWMSRSGRAYRVLLRSCTGWFWNFRKKLPFY